MEEPKRGIIEKTAEMFRLPGDLAAGLPRVEIIGSTRVLVENHRGVVLYTEERIDVNGGRILLSVKGSGLEIRAMNRHELMICGNVEGVELLR